MKKTYDITGMHCKSCSKLIEAELEDKVKSISVNADTNKATIEFDEKKITEKGLSNIISGLGYKMR